MSKVKRQKKLLEVIKQKEIETQEELISVLNGSGYQVTQATISRDINELQLIKIAGKEKKDMIAQLQAKREAEGFVVQE